MSLDLQTFGFISAWASLIRAKPHSDVTLKSLAAFRETALRCPMDFHFFGAKPDIEKQIFLKAFSIMEDFRKNEEMHAPGGWQVCCLFHQAKELQRVHSKGGAVPDPVADLCYFFCGLRVCQDQRVQVGQKGGEGVLDRVRACDHERGPGYLDTGQGILGPKELFGSGVQAHRDQPEGFGELPAERPSRRAHGLCPGFCLHSLTVRTLARTCWSALPQGHRVAHGDLGPQGVAAHARDVQVHRQDRVGDPGAHGEPVPVVQRACRS